MVFLAKSLVCPEPRYFEGRLFYRLISCGLFGVVYYRYTPPHVPRKLYLCLLWVGVCRHLVNLYDSISAYYSHVRDNKLYLLKTIMNRSVMLY